MFVIGLTGSIAMGKTTTARLFAEEGVPVYDADAAVHRLYESEAVALIEAAFPGVTRDGKVDRALLGPQVLGNAPALKRLEAELGVIRPEILICLGSTAAQSILGGEVRVLRDRGRFLKSEFCTKTLVTVHPSSLLRAPDEETRARDYAQFVEDLRKAAKALGE